MQLQGLLLTFLSFNVWIVYILLSDNPTVYGQLCIGENKFIWKVVVFMETLKNKFVRDGGGGMAIFFHAEKLKN